MKIRVQLILESADGSEPETITEEIGCFSRSNEGHDLLGLSLETISNRVLEIRPLAAVLILTDIHSMQLTKNRHIFLRQ